MIQCPEAIERVGYRYFNREDGKLTIAVLIRRGFPRKDVREEISLDSSSSRKYAELSFRVSDEWFERANKQELEFGI